METDAINSSGFREFGEDVGTTDEKRAFQSMESALAKPAPGCLPPLGQRSQRPLACCVFP